MDLTPLIQLLSGFKGLTQLIGVTLNVNPPPSVILKKGESTIIKQFNWKKFSFVYKVIEMDDQGNIHITNIG